MSNIYNYFSSYWSSWYWWICSSSVASRCPEHYHSSVEGWWYLCCKDLQRTWCHLIVFSIKDILPCCDSDETNELPKFQHRYLYFNHFKQHPHTWLNIFHCRGFCGVSEVLSTRRICAHNGEPSAWSPVLRLESVGRTEPCDCTLLSLWWSKCLWLWHDLSIRDGLRIQVCIVFFMLSNYNRLIVAFLQTTYSSTNQSSLQGCCRNEKEWSARQTNQQQYTWNRKIDAGIESVMLASTANVTSSFLLFICINTYFFL